MIAKLKYQYIETESFINSSKASGARRDGVTNWNFMPSFGLYDKNKFEPNLKNIGLEKKLQVN